MVFDAETVELPDGKEETKVSTYYKKYFKRSRRVKDIIYSTA